MSATEYLIDTNILIYHTRGSEESISFMTSILSQKTFNISVITKIEFLGWDKHTPDGVEKCKRLLELVMNHDPASTLVSLSFMFFFVNFVSFVVKYFL